MIKNNLPGSVESSHMWTETATRDDDIPGVEPESTELDGPKTTMVGFAWGFVWLLNDELFDVFDGVSTTMGGGSGMQMGCCFFSRLRKLPTRWWCERAVGPSMPVPPAEPLKPMPPHDPVT